MSGSVFVLGSFAVDTVYRMPRMPALGETLPGSGFHMGPGGKGSNQAIAAARAGAHVTLLTAIGNDSLAQVGRETWAQAGLDASLVKTVDQPTGAAAILVDDRTGENAIVVVPGACGLISAADVEAAQDHIGNAKVFLAQMEVPIEAVRRGLQIARAAKVITVLNPAPVPLHGLPDDVLAFVDYLVPNEVEVCQLAGESQNAKQCDLRRAAHVLQARGCREVLLTLGEKGAMWLSQDGRIKNFPSVSAGHVIDTTGAGDAFCGAFAAAVAEGKPVIAAAEFASAAAGISVTRHGAALSAPTRDEIETQLA